MAPPEHMACQELVEVVTGYLEGTLPARDRARFEAHLAVCDPCVVYLEQMRATVALTGRLSLAALPTPMREGLIEAFRGWRAA